MDLVYDVFYICTRADFSVIDIVFSNEVVEAQDAGVVVALSA